MQRIYFLLPTLSATKALVRDLRGQGLREEQLHVMARQRAGLEDLPEASDAEKTDVVPAMRRGLLIGGGVGLLMGLLVAALSQAGWQWSVALVAVVTVAGCGFGGWAAALAGAAMDREPVARSEEDLRKGAVMVMVDVPEEDAKALEAQVLERYPDARIEDEEGLHS